MISGKISVKLVTNPAHKAAGEVLGGPTGYIIVISETVVFFIGLYYSNPIVMCGSFFLANLFELIVIRTTPNNDQP
jgi:hypothetical protein